MTLDEFDYQWDLLYNNIASNQAPGLDKYEKSVFLTQAQLEVVMSMYNGTLGGFESTESVRKYLSPLVETVKLIDQDAPSDSGTHTHNGVEEIRLEHRTFILPDDLMFILYEEVVASDKATSDCLKDKTFEVYPVKLDEYHRIRNNPFRGTLSNRVLRLDVGYVSNPSGSSVSTPVKCSELVLPESLQADFGYYLIRYLRRPKPIILKDLTGNDTIEGETSHRECELDSSIHNTILNVAIQKAYGIRPQ